ncbi:MAG: hypothetical protein ABL961_03860 [Vicinamibacterales bacterium]
MQRSNSLRRSGSRWIGRRSLALLTIATATLIAGYTPFARHTATVAAQTGGELRGMGIVTGTVTAGKPFKAAQVYLRSQDGRRHMLYMVYTQAGAFKAVAVMPGTYDLIAKARGLESDPQPIVIKMGTNPAVTVAMHDSTVPNAYPTIVDQTAGRAANGAQAERPQITYASYEEIYPPGPGRDVLEAVCMQCHGENFFPGRPSSPQGWKLGFEKMMGTNLLEHDRINLGEGVLAGSASGVRFGPRDRKDLLEYLQKNFGLDKKRRAVKTDVEMPLDEAALAKAQYIEYYTVSEQKEAASSGQSTAANDSESAATGTVGVRTIMQVSMDAEGNRWAVDRGVPSRIVRLDPRTGEQKAWNLPDKRAGVHDQTMDRQGNFWVLEFTRIEDGRVDGSGAGSVGLHSRLLGFNPRTEKWEHEVDPDPESVIRAERKGPLMGGLVDSNGKIWMHWMLTGAISSYDPATKKAATYRIPTHNATPYGAAIDPFDNIWVAEWNGGRLARFDQSTGAWTEFISPIYPANFRRGPESDAEGNIWVGIWAAGNRPGKIAKLDQKTGRWQMWDIPHRGALPYEASVDRDGNIWFPDTSTSDRPMANAKLNPKDGTFVFYPRPQFVADSTRLMHAEDGSIHYTARYGAARDMSGFGVLYTDKDKITTLAPKMLNGSPGYAFKAPAAAKRAQQQ